MLLCSHHGSRQVWRSEGLGMPAGGPQRGIMSLGYAFRDSDLRIRATDCQSSQQGCYASALRPCTPLRLKCHGVKKLDGAVCC